MALADRDCIRPTILHLMGLPVPDDMDGRVLTQALTSSRPVEFRPANLTDAGVQAGLSEEETTEVEERLRALGYLG